MEEIQDHCLVPAGNGLDIHISSYEYGEFSGRSLDNRSLVVHDHSNVGHCSNDTSEKNIGGG